MNLSESCGTVVDELLNLPYVRSIQGVTGRGQLVIGYNIPIGVSTPVSTVGIRGADGILAFCIEEEYLTLPVVTILTNINVTSLLDIASRAASQTRIGELASEIPTSLIQRAGGLNSIEGERSSFQGIFYE